MDVKHCLQMKIPIFYKKDDIPESVKDKIIQYLKDNLHNYELIKVIRKSNHPDDFYLYTVIAQHKISKTYTVWSCWNDKTESLNHGHYDIESLSNAEQLAESFFNDQSDIFIKSTNTHKERCEKLKNQRVTTNEQKKALEEKIEECNKALNILNSYL